MCDDSRISPARLCWDDDGQPLSRHYDDFYFSSTDGQAETRYVFLQHNGLPRRWLNHGASPFTLAETGFGSGLNFLVTWQQWQQQAPTGRLHFISVEKHPLTHADLTRIHALWPDLQPLAKQLQAQYPPCVPGYHRLSFDQGRVTLTLIFGDALASLSQLDARIDGWYLDGFTPSRNPQMWNQALYQQLARLTPAGGTFSTFTAASAVRRGLQAAGFAVNTAAGFGLKRHMLWGSKRIDTVPLPRWHQPTNDPIPASVIVIGAGIAGCSAARALAERGIPVTLVDQAPAAANGASGNPQGILYAKLPAVPTQESRIHLAGYLHSLRLLARHCRDDRDTWDRCGVLQLALSETEQRKQAKLIDRGHYPPELLRGVDPDTASKLAGRPLTRPGLFFPGGGWVNPPRFCQRLLDHPLITQRYRCRVERLIRRDGGWLLVDAAGAELASAPCVIVANASDALRFEQLQGLPLKKIRGQISSVSQPADQPLNTVLCGQGYISPPRQQRYCFGASFDLKSPQADVLERDHQHNLQRVDELCPALAQALATQPVEHWQGRASFRCTAPDYLPLVGPVAREAEFIETYAPLRQDATAHIDAAPPLYRGLYASLAQGSKGLISAPLAAELLVSYICHDPMPLEQPLIKALHPARFLVKNLIRRAI